MTRDERLERLEHERTVTRQSFLTILEQLAELNLRMLFVMNHFQYQRPLKGGLIIDGQQQMERKCLYDLYAEGGRDAILNKIAEQQQEIAAALQGAMSEYEDERAALGAEAAGDTGAPQGTDEPETGLSAEQAGA